jgi:hypothetical protein
MNQPTKTTLTLLGIVACVGIASALFQGLGNRIASPYQPPGQHRYTTHRSGGGVSPAHLTLPEMPSGMVTICPTPAPAKSLREGYSRIKCAKCGQEYDFPSVGCWRLLELQEIKHLHLSPQAEARMIKNLNARQEVVKSPWE